VRTLTNHPGDGLADVEVRPLAYDDPAALARSFDGVDTFYNTFWMRTGDATGYATALARSQALIDAAVAAGVERIVHISVLHADRGPQYPYFRAKAEVEALLRRSGVPHAIVRPAIMFGGRAPMLDQLARLLRRSPVFGIAGDGRYRVRPVHVDDVARLCVAGAATAVPDAVPVDAVGPDRPTFEEFVRQVRSAVGGHAVLVHLPARLVLASAKVLGRVLGDELLTRDELLSTITGLADVEGPATGPTSLSAWLAEHGHELGRR
jgi:uncharacterized protein YbjT (DUF2867 family)